MGDGVQRLAQLSRTSVEGHWHSSIGGELQSHVEVFVKSLQARYAAVIEQRPREFKKEVIRLLKWHLPPHSKPAGRPRQLRITRAFELYQHQARGVESGARKEVNWVEIARECIPGFNRKSDVRRQSEITRLRNAVYARLQRLGRTKSRRPSSH